MPEPTLLTVGTAAAKPGDVVAGWIDVPAAADAGTRIPVTAACGTRPGPVLALVAGTHGAEYTSMLALQRVRARLDPARMAGGVILVHMANPPCFYGRRVYYGPDGKNLNRVYPGAADGTISERIAHALTREVIARCTHLVDMHCGDGNEACRPYAYWIVSGNREVDAASRELALAYGLDHIVVDRGRPTDPARSLYTSSTAVLRGKPALTAESGGMGRTDEASVGYHERGALSALAHLGILAAPSVRVERPVWIDRNEVLRAPATGMWHAAVEPMQSLAAGTLVGRLTDPWGDLLHEVRAPFAAIVLYVVATPPVTEGEPLAGLGHVAAGDVTA
jgi:predicted deacylase